MKYAVVARWHFYRVLHIFRGTPPSPVVFMVWWRASDAARRRLNAQSGSYFLTDSAALAKKECLLPLCLEDPFLRTGCSVYCMCSENSAHRKSWGS